MEELEFKFENTLQEEGLSVNDLPMEIRKSIKAIAPNYARFQKNPTDAMRDSLIRMDVDICNSIYDWLDEKSENEEAEKARIEAERIAAEQAEAAQKAAQDEAEKARVEAERIAAEQAEAAQKAAQDEAEKARVEAEKIAAEQAAAQASANGKKVFGDAEMVTAIKARIEANGGNIPIKELKSIINKEPDYPHQIVHNIKLHKPFAKSFYVLV